jgi:hypothetical protein
VKQAPRFFAPRGDFFSSPGLRSAAERYPRQGLQRRLLDPPWPIRLRADRGLSTWLWLRRAGTQAPHIPECSAPPADTQQRRGFDRRISKKFIDLTITIGIRAGFGVPEVKRNPPWQVNALSRLNFRVPCPPPFTGSSRATRYGDPEYHRPEGRCFGFDGESGALSPTRNLSIDKALVARGDVRARKERAQPFSGQMHTP